MQVYVEFSFILTPASETVNVEAVNVEGTLAGNAEGTSANTKQKSVATAKDTSAQIIEELDSLHLETPPETVDSLRAYEKDTGEAQRFLGTTKILYILLFYCLIN